MRVLYVQFWSSLKSGGSPLAGLEMMVDMKKRYNVECCALIGGEGDFAEKCRENNIKVFVAPKNWAWWMYYPSNNTSVREFLRRCKNQFKDRIKNLLRYPVIQNMFKNQKFDLIHSNFSVTDIGDYLAQNLKPPHVWHLREQYFKPSLLHSRNEIARKFQRADKIIMISKKVYDYYVNETKLCKPENSKIIYDGLQINPEYNKKYNSKINFCMAGGLSFSKNQIMALRACKILRERNNNFNLNFIGEGGSEKELENFVHENNLNDCVKFWGFRSDIQEILKNMDVGLMLSKSEAFGRVTVEYMLNYMPVIGVNAEATPEIISDGTGFICELDDAQRLADIMYCEFIKQPEKIISMGQNARDHAVKNFPLEKNTDEIYKVYQEVLNGK